MVGLAAIPKIRARHRRTTQAWHQLRAAVQEINYVARRSAELQMRLPR
jgi:hypothetical protein